MSIFTCVPSDYEGSEADYKHDQCIQCCRCKDFFTEEEDFDDNIRMDDQEFVCHECVPEYKEAWATVYCEEA